MDCGSVFFPGPQENKGVCVELHVFSMNVIPCIAVAAIREENETGA